MKSILGLLNLLKHLVVSEDFIFLHLHTKLHRMLSWLGHRVLIVDRIPVFADFSGKERALKQSAYTLYTANALNITLTTKNAGD